MKKINRGFIFYLFILLGILLGAFLLCVVIMIFSPGTSILGLSYYNENQSTSYQKTEVYNFNKNTGNSGWLSFTESGIFEINLEKRNSETETAIYIVSGGGASVAKFNPTNEEQQIPDSSTVRQFINGEIGQPLEGSYAIKDGGIAFTKEGDYIVQIDQSKFVLYRVVKNGKNLSYTTYITSDSLENDDTEQSIMKIEVPNLFVLDNAQFTAIANGEYLLTDRYWKQFKAIKTDDILSVFLPALEPTYVESVTISEVEEPSTLCEINEGKITFKVEAFKEGLTVYTINVKFTNQSTKEFRAEITKSEGQISTSYYETSTIPDYVCSVRVQGINARTSYFTVGESSQLTDLDIDTIKVISNSHFVQVKRATPTDENNISMRVYVNNKTSGFKTGNVVASSMSIKYFLDTKVLEVVANIPEGFWVTSNSSSITIRLPNLTSENMNGDFNYNIDAGNGSVSFSSEPGKEGFFSTTTGIGWLKVKTTGSLNISNTAPFNTEDKALSELGAVELDVGSMSTSTPIIASSVTIKSSGNLTLNTDGVAIESYKDVKIETIDSYSIYGEINLSNADSKVYLSNNYGEQVFSKINGNVTVDEKSRNCNYSFEEINGNINAGRAALSDEEKEIKVENCNFTIKSINGQIDIHTTGKVN